jgi:uncharacterized membrane protein
MFYFCSDFTICQRRPLTELFTGALVIVGAFTFLPGRILHAVAFGP